MMPSHVPPQYVLVSHEAEVEPSVNANLSVRTWYMDCERHAAGDKAAARVAPKAVLRNVFGNLIIPERDEINKGDKRASERKQSINNCLDSRRIY